MAVVSSESVEMYLKSVAELGGGEAPVAISRVAERLGVTAVSASEMMKRLEAQQFIAHLPYKGVTLTDDGRQLAHDVIRRQRLWECFLVDHLDIDWAKAHDLACDLEHATAPEVTEALAVYLGQPARCPHGNPIPDLDGGLSPPPGQPLNTLHIGQNGRIVAIEPESGAVLAYLDARGVRPGQTVIIVEIGPLDGPLTVRIGGSDVALGQALAALVRVVPDAGG